MSWSLVLLLLVVADTCNGIWPFSGDTNFDAEAELPGAAEAMALDLPPTLECALRGLDELCKGTLAPLPNVRIVPKPSRYEIPADTGFDGSADRNVLNNNERISATQPGRVPKHTKGLGFVAYPQPPELFALLRENLEDMRDKASKEYNIRGYLNNNDGPGQTAPTFMRDLPLRVKDQIVKMLQPRLEEWSNSRLKFEALYGIREYTNSSRLWTHVDRGDTHVISVILNVGQEGMATPWPLEIESHDNKWHDVYIAPGVMVFYEGARLHHGRPYRLNGKSFFNAFLHFSPIGWRL